MKAKVKFQQDAITVKAMNDQNTRISRKAGLSLKVEGTSSMPRKENANRK